MRSGLCLRIPAIQELSPSPVVSKCASLSSSFNKPASPKPSTGKSHHRTVTHSSPYHIITSSASIKKISLPSFLRINQDHRDDILTKIPLGKSAISHASDCPTDSSSIKAANDDPALSIAKKAPPKTPEEFIAKIFEKGQPTEEKLLKVGKIELSRGELQSLHPKAALSRNVIDACLRCIKHKNRKFFKSAESHDRVLIINTNFSQMIFSTSKECRVICPRNPVKYEFVLFPVFIGYWTLLALDNRQKKLIMHNIEKVGVLAEQIFACVREFIRREIRHHERKDIELTGFRELSFEIVDYGKVEDSDSAALAVRIAYKIAINNKAQANVEVLSDFRYNLILMLFKHGVSNSANV